MRRCIDWIEGMDICIGTGIGIGETFGKARRLGYSSVLKTALRLGLDV
jgi:hypothetical protein